MPPPCILPGLRGLVHLGEFAKAPATILPMGDRFGGWLVDPLTFPLRWLG